jgi:hypothetical protein
MGNFAGQRIALLGAALCCSVISAAFGEPPRPQAVQETSRDTTPASRPRRPGGLLSDSTGEFLTIEGIKVEHGKYETNTLLVDTVDGTKLEKPVTLLIRASYVADHNLKPAKFTLEAKKRYVLKGYESGEMIGIAPAVYAAAKEAQWREAPMSSAGWKWRPYFETLIEVGTNDLGLSNH